MAGVNDGEAPPVPIPNTEVKLTSAHNTWMETSWEDRSTPAPKKASQFGLLLSLVGLQGLEPRTYRL